MSTHARRPKGVFVGLATVDILYAVEKIPRRNEKISVPGQVISAGGPATNAAVTFAFLGGAAELVTAVGSHPLSAVIRRDLHRHSARLHDMAPNDARLPPVSSILVLRTTGERTVVSANAAVFSPIQAAFNPLWLRGASIVQVDGHYMATCIAASRLAREREIPVVLDSGSWKPGMAGLLPFVDMAICSDDYRPPGCRSKDDVLEFLRARRIPQIAITGGASAVRWLDKGKRGSIAIKKIQSVDTLGAGDIFHGAFCYYACQRGASFRDALAGAARVASFSCRHPGTRAWMTQWQT